MCCAKKHRKVDSRRDAPLAQGCQHRFKHGIRIERTGVNLNGLERPIRLQHCLTMNLPVIFPTSLKKPCSIDCDVFQCRFNPNFQNWVAIGMGTL